jgi:3-deoxy-D-manno-octulosonic-acid transferase
MGELATTYAVADMVFVGGSLVPRGGHNILEPALFKKPVLFGPYMDNFKEVASCFLSRQAAIQVRSPEELAIRFLELAENKGLRQMIGENGFQILLSNRGATDLVLRRVEAVLECNLSGNHCERNP